ncbi:Protein argonaute 2 [Camellia lanceoleosa]|uniref:Protein argonaute 2 n=1 Tax=Camellia lanceoleosa TaxID=1840588 RepID=A0ACC0GBL3_9ERIC|nr:Protein argonaute 2 [Camellia lanceoleosa]
MCLDLVNTYARLNKVKPKKIVVFRDGVSESQFDMVLNEELQDLKNAIYEGNYCPTITLVVTQKRHHTHLFLENEREGGASSNMPPRTVVDTTIVHPFEFDFYLCSHHGNLGTSKPTHYYVLWDEHNFTSDKLQKLIYDLCFTFARCTKHVSLVPPVYYADLVAYQGRLFQEVMNELQSPPSVPSSSTLTPAVSLNERFYTPHRDL